MPVCHELAITNAPENLTILRFSRNTKRDCQHPKVTMTEMFFVIFARLISQVGASFCTWRMLFIHRLIFHGVD